jgi:hypothetical protein
MEKERQGHGASLLDPGVTEFSDNIMGKTSSLLEEQAALLTLACGLTAR